MGSSDGHQARLGDRSLFPALEPRAYLNHAAVSPPSLAVRAAAERVLADYERVGVGAVMHWVEQRERLKGKLARLIGARAEDVALVSNTTRGVTDIALCIPWQPGDRVVLFKGEFPANTTPWQRAADLFGLEIAWLDANAFLDEPEAALAGLDAELDRGVRLVAASMVEFQTGLRMPLAAIGAACHRYGAELAVDAIQGLGVAPLDAPRENVDYLACGSHKWLMGLEGVAFVYVAPERVAALRPVVAGWLSHEDALEFLHAGAGHLRYDRPIKRGADFLEGGATNAVGCAALEASFDLIDQLGVPAVFDHVQRYHDALEPALVARGFKSRRATDIPRRSGTLSLLPPAGVDVVDVHRELGARGISCSIPDGLLRFSPQWPNALEEVPVVLEAVDQAILAAT